MPDEADQQSAGFRRTGHDFVDFGIATLMARCGLTAPEAKPEDLTLAQLEKFAAEVEGDYFTKPDPFKSIMLVFGSNFMNPSFTDEQKKEVIRAHLLAFKAELNPELPQCTFFQRPAVREIARDAYPLLMGREPINFYPGGQPGIAVSGQAIVAAQALIFGGLRSQGKIMVLGADDFQFVRDVTVKWAQEIRRRIHLSKISGAELEDVAPPRTILVKTLEDLERDRNRSYVGGATLYHFSNSGQGPSLDIYRLPAPIMRFVQLAQKGDREYAWREIRRHWWAKPKAAKLKKNEPLPEEYEPAPEQQLNTANRFFNDLFNLPQESGRFVRLYFFRTMRGLQQKAPNWNAEQARYVGVKIRGLGQLLDLFLKEVLEVDAQRVVNIKSLADRLAHIVRDDPARYRDLMMVRRNWSEIRRALRQLSSRETKQGRAPVVGLDQFFSIFEMGEEADRVDWGLAWDLVLIHFMERLYELDPNFLKKNPDVNEALEDDSTPANTD
jgi:CRISPR-associated protein Cst1